MHGNVIEIGIGKLAEGSGVNIETIRYYERIGLLPRARRSGNRYRRYGVADIERLRFVRRARDLGFALEEVRALLDLDEDPPHACRQAQKLAESHLSAVKKRIADLRRMERALTDLVGRCVKGERPRCPLVEALGGEQR